MATAGLIQELAATWEVWAEVGRRLPESAWHGRTRLPGWTVRDLYAHAGRWPVGFRRFVQAPVFDEPPAFRSGAALLAYFNQPGGLAATSASAVANSSAADASAHPTDVLVARFAEAGPGALAVAAGLGPDEHLRYAGLVTVTVCCALEVGVVESTVHLLDLRAALAELASVTVAIPTSALAVTRDVLAAVPDPVAFIEAATGRTSRSILPVLR